MTRPMGSPRVGALRRHGPSCSGTPRDVDEALAVVVLGARPLFMDLDREMCGAPTRVSSRNVCFDRKPDEGSGSAWP